MARLILLLAALFAAYYWWLRYKKSPPGKRRGLLLRSAFWTLLGLLVILAVTGRMHWIAVAVAAVIPVFKGLLAIALRVLPFLNLRKTASAAQKNPPQTANLTEQEAWQVLGLEPGASRDEIVAAHKRLIQKLHPDRGGNDYLAARINQAKELLLNRQK